MFSNHNSCFEKLDRRCNLINKLSLCPFYCLKISAKVYVNFCRYFNFRLFERNRIQSLKYLRFSIFCCKDTGIGKSEFMAKTQFFWSFLLTWALILQKSVYRLYRKIVQLNCFDDKWPYMVVSMEKYQFRSFKKSRYI